MKTYSLLPFTGLLLLARMFTGIGVMFLMSPASSFVGGGMCVAGICFAVFADYAYRGCRICEKTAPTEDLKS